LPILDNFGITKQIKSLFGKTVTFKNGAYLIIEHTEALHVVDVNSGNRNKSKLGQEESAYEVMWPRRRDCPSIAITGYGWYHRHRLHRYEQGRASEQALLQDAGADGE